MFGWTVIPRIGFGDFGVSPHGIGIAIGYFVGAMLMARRARAVGYDEDHTWNGAAVGVIGAMLGARVAYVAGHFSDFSSPVEWLKIWQGGISLVGGLLGAFAAVFIYTRVKKISFFELVDLGAPGLAIGIALGRIGDLAIGDHLGKETAGFWGWKYLGGELISPPPCLTPAGSPVYSTLDGCIAPGTVVHQTALYDMGWSLVILAILLLLDRRPRNRGFLFLSWAALYAVGRIATDFLRVDKHWFGLGLTGSQLTSITVLLICGFFLLRYRGVPIHAVAAEPVPTDSASEEAELQEPLLPTTDLHEPQEER
ncbi:MAG TPA: prolipoprotein diacylglyceryl transferase family protein [Actinomycetota bacterium]|nr:prolipoprotein diacylglyceryl transferase family protein [Actinomycetota bacterium]